MRNFLTLALLTAMSVISPEAHAEIGDVYAMGSNCYSSSPTSTTIAGSAYYNTSSSSVTMGCPILSYLRPDSGVEVYVHDRSTSSGISCYLCVESGGSWACGSSATATSTSGTGYYTQSPSWGGIISTATSGGFYVECTVPGSSSSSTRSGIVHTYWYGN